jgi:HEAT repeat protein
MDRIAELKHFLETKDIHFLILELGSPHAEVRHQAHANLLRKGDDAIQPLLALIHGTDQCLANEAAQILGEMSSPGGPRSLVAALDDDDPSVRWSAIEALASFGRGGIVALLETLAEGNSSIRLTSAAIEILNAVSTNHYLTREEDKVLAMLQGAYPDYRLAKAAKAALENLKDSGCPNSEVENS